MFPAVSFNFPGKRTGSINSLGCISALYRNFSHPKAYSPVISHTHSELDTKLIILVPPFNAKCDLPQSTDLAHPKSPDNIRIIYKIHTRHRARQQIQHGKRHQLPINAIKLMKTPRRPLLPRLFVNVCLVPKGGGTQEAFELFGGDFFEAFPVDGPLVFCIEGEFFEG